MTGSSKWLYGLSGGKGCPDPSGFTDSLVARAALAGLAWPDRHTPQGGRHFAHLTEAKASAGHALHMGEWGPDVLWDWGERAKRNVLENTVPAFYLFSLGQLLIP